MKVITKKLPKSEILLTIEIEADEMRKFKISAAEEIGKEIRVDGFRPGKAPYEIVVQKVGEEYLQMIAQEKAAAKTYPQAVVQEKILPLASADFKVLNKDPFTFEIKAAVFPEFSIKDLDKVYIKKEKVEVTEKEVEEVLEEMRKQKSIWHDVESKVKHGNRVEVDFEGFDAEKKEALGKTNSKNHPIVIGDKMMVPGFEDAIVGMSKDEKKEFEIIFPKDYHSKDFQDKKVLFKLKVNRVEERKMPEIDEKFIEEISGEKMSLAELKKKIKENLEHEKLHREISKQEDNFVKALDKGADLDFSDILTQDEARGILDKYKAEAEQYKIEWVKYLQIIKKTEEEIKKQALEDAKKRLRNTFLIEKAMEIETIQISDEEAKAYIAEVLQKADPKERYKIEKLYKKDSDHYKNLKHSLKVKKLFAKHIEGYEEHKH
ncbi:MAG: trigger factor, trigger factor [Candidatus Peregrinibacteria bacterium GW2011_GWF2_33_10]|nr:MAG: trigger factor, trigger factor [Candidatus Peregrinibacteria bacterium GW2011_GWF2_33_10]OGJ45409.1 MAG: trigger factor [Candidatus Peregrinibacteria bacterium RIFOXYA2_FULL_33_21]OGJ45530.1 MAG: trigger factor [Candidatus Peregrinibacteria bacterium RIFOXYA12_FULL_33_12]OGJ51012.1 MAG: trigger factor [Candidatus Peregrinibacteria bacterium RIFOXYB2_FULL_33_20]